VKRSLVLLSSALAGQETSKINDVLPSTLLAGQETSEIDKTSEINNFGPLYIL
jgi:hypothetical protein